MRGREAGLRLKLALAMMAAGGTNVMAATGDAVLINEVLASHTGTDDTEFVELFGTPGTSLDGLSLIVVEGDSFGAGTMDRRLDFGADDAIGSNGFFLVGNPTGLLANYGVVPNLEIAANYLENSSLTVALARTASLAGDAGSLVTGAEEVLDSVALTDGGVDDLFYFGAPVIGPDGSYFPAGAWRLADGVDTDTAADWSMSDFNLGATNTPTSGDVPPPPEPTVATIMEIQGEAHVSPLVDERIRTSGIVTAVDSNGFYLQDPVGDGNLYTSDGILVFTSSSPTVAVGDEVEVVGTVDEYIPGGASTNNLSTTEIAPQDIQVLSSGNALPATTRIGGADGRLPPTEIIDNDPLLTFDVFEDGINFYESMEGMRVTVVDALSVSGTNRYGETFVVAGGGKMPRVTGASRRGTLNISPDDFNPERIQLQLDSGILPDFDVSVNTGTYLGDVTGVVGYNFGNFEVSVTEVATPIKDREETRNVTPYGPRDTWMTVASYNVLNLDPVVEEGVSSSNIDDDVGNGRFAAIAGHIVYNLRHPDVIALQEVQDNDGAEPSDVTAADVTLQLLVDGIAALSGVQYAFIDNPFIGNETNGGQPGGNIRVAFLYNPARVSLVEDSVEAVVDPFDQQTNTENPFYDSRPPLAATFTFNGEPVTVVTNHFSSKGGSSPLFGQIQPSVELQEDPSVNGGVAERRAQAEAVRAFVSDKLALDAAARVVVTGDFNEFEFISPLQILSQDMENLTLRLPENERYSYIFDGNSQSLDHMLVSPALGAKAKFGVLHLNSEYAETPDRASDHDPLIGAFHIEAPEADD